ncbi:putative pectin methyltransferase QUA2 [Capsicum chacoense]
MSRPLHRGVSVGGRLSVNGPDFWDDSQMKDKVEKEDLERNRSPGDQTYLSTKFLCRVLFPDNSPSKHSLGENGLISDPFSPGAGRNRLKYALLLIRLSLVFIIILALTGSFWWTISITSSSRGQIYHGYRKLQEQVVSDLRDIGQLSLGAANVKDVEYCPPESENFIPCFNVSENLDLGLSKGEEVDRYCGPGSRQNCLVLPPVNYKIPLRWPTGRDVIWHANVNITAQEVLSSGSLTKRLMMLEEEQISFRSDSAMFDSIEDYSHQIAEMIGLRNESNFVQAGVRTILDIGCGYGSFGAHLFSSQLLTMCVANYEASGSQVQLTLERGLPAMIGSFNSKQLPYPSLSFDMIHCAECHVDWDQKDGILLVEVDRLLRPGGYFVWTSTVTNTQRSVRNKVSLKKWNFVRNFAESMCWKLSAQQDATVVWKKTSLKKCYVARRPGVGPSLCSKGQDIESPYYRPLQACIAGTQCRRWIPIEERTKWPSRAKLNSSELKIHGLSSEALAEDSLNWNSAVNNYWSLLSPLIFSDHPKRPGDDDPSPPYNMLRNVLDMNAHFGGLNAALLDARKSVWVMNVIPTSGPNYLPLILDRGFVGVLHDWCEAFPTYPRTYDLIHANGLLSLEFGQHSRCPMFDLFIEMDRVLRPEHPSLSPTHAHWTATLNEAVQGWVIIRDTVPLIELARAHAARLKWDARVVEVESSDEKLLICQKPFSRRQAS